MRKPTGNLRGRPRIEIDKKLFENACALQCTLEEVSALFECSSDTIERWCKSTYGEIFAEVYKKKSAKGKMSLRRNQFKLSEVNATMAIWLGKQYLGQKDNKEEDKTESGEIQPTFNFVFSDVSMKGKDDGK